MDISFRHSARFGIRILSPIPATDSVYVERQPPKRPVRLAPALAALKHLWPRETNHDFDMASDTSPSEI
jgi:hypothetical protein